MSVMDMAWAFQTDAEPGPRFILVALANYADDQHLCWPSVATLSRVTGYSRASIQRYLTALEDGGFITREARSTKAGRTSNLYRLLVGVTRSQHETPLPHEEAPLPHEEAPLPQPETLGGLSVRQEPSVVTTKEPLGGDEVAAPALFAVPDAPVKAKSRRRPETPLPDGWRPKPEHVALAAKHGLDGPMEEQKFRAWTSARDQRYRDWDAGFRNHLLREAERSASRQAHPSARDSWDHIPTPDQVYAQALARSGRGS